MNDRILIAGTHSGCGKTTVTLALLAAFAAGGKPLSAFKCGPDFIDPMFHRRILGLPSYNLDPFFCDGSQLCALLARARGTLSVMEGVMGYYDGVGPQGVFSTCEVAQKTRTPVILVVNTAGMHTSAGAILRGFRLFREENQIAGVIFNNASLMTYESLRQLAAAEGLRPLGCLPRCAEISVGSRHLGLITADEIADWQEKLARLGQLAREHLDLDGIAALAASAPALAQAEVPAAATARVRVAVARDEAFCFLYEENLAALRQAGAETVFFSPLHDKALPPDVGGLYLPGGYPELHAQALSQNTAIQEAIRRAVGAGMPTVAECGGFLYLHDTLDGVPMAGVIHAAAAKTDRLQRFGYVTLRAGEDNLLCRAGETIRGHEFHYYDSGDCGGGFRAEKPVSGKSWDCVHVSDTLYAGFPHLYLPSNPGFARAFVQKATAFTASAGGAVC